jgi:hypothetical protein
MLLLVCAQVVIQQQALSQLQQQQQGASEAGTPTVLASPVGALLASSGPSANIGAADGGDASLAGGLDALREQLSALKTQVSNEHDRHSWMRWSETGMPLVEVGGSRGYLKTLQSTGVGHQARSALLLCPCH